MSETKAQKKDREHALTILHENINPGDTVYTILRSVARSGMSRRLSVVILTGDGPWDITGLVARALGDRFQKDGTIRVQGCGMDAGFATAYDLASVMFPAGFECIGEGCPSNDHSNGDTDYTPHLHGDGGYALRHRWI